MTQLRDCYFCGAVEATLESYRVIPPETDPPEDRQRTVVLCPTCREKLGRVLDPVVGYLDSSTVEADREGRDEYGETGDGDTAAEVLKRQGDEGTDEERSGDTGEEIESTHDEPTRGPRQEPIGEGQDQRAGEDNPGVASDTDDRTRPADLPDGTRKLVRLLRNREFPVERGALVTIAANAYEINRQEAIAAIDALIEHGWLIERDGELHRPE